MKRLLLPVVALALLTGAAKPPPPVSMFVGSYPFDKIRGFTVLSLPAVRAATVRAIGANPAISRWVLGKEMTASPITAQGGVTLVSACEPHNCGPHNWSVAIKGNGASAIVCHYDLESGSEAAHWYAGGRLVHRSPGQACPNRADDIDPAAMKFLR